VAESTEQIWIEVGHGRPFVIEDRQAATDGTTCREERRKRRAKQLAGDDADERGAEDKGREDGRADASGCCSS
jgi:hypothetical protein